MKTAFIVSGKSPTTMPGGLGSYSYNVARTFNKLDYKVYIVGISDKNEILETEFCTFIHVRSRLRKLASITAFIMMHSLEKKIRQIIAQEKPQEIIFYGAGIWGRVGNLVKRKTASTNIPIYTIAAYFTTFRHEYAGQLKGSPTADYGLGYNLAMKMLLFLINIFYVPKEHRTLRELDRIVVHYDSSRKILLDELPDLQPDKIVKTPYFIESYERKGVSEAPAKFDRKRVVCICRQDPRKGINTLLHAVKLLKAEGTEFDCVIAGTGPFLGPNRKLSRKLGVDDLVYFPGFISSIEEILASADIYAFPSVEEGSGAISLLEAMASGLPIVTTRCDGIPEDFIEEKTALLAEPGNVEAFADMLKRLLNDEVLCERLGNHVKEDYANRFTLDKMVIGIRELLSSL